MIPKPAIRTETRQQNTVLHMETHTCTHISDDETVWQFVVGACLYEYAYVYIAAYPSIVVAMAPGNTSSENSFAPLQMEMS